MIEIYQENILDHYKNPRNKGELKNANIRQKESNPLCGDVLEYQLLVKKGVIEEIRFIGSGCAISLAAASMLTEKVKGKKIEEIKNLSKEEIYGMLGIPLTPSRVKCALLCLKAIKVAAYSYLHEKMDEETF